MKKLYPFGVFIIRVIVWVKLDHNCNIHDSVYFCKYGDSGLEFDQPFKCCSHLTTVYGTARLRLLHTLSEVEGSGLVSERECLVFYVSIK